MGSLAPASLAGEDRPGTLRTPGSSALPGALGSPSLTASTRPGHRCSQFGSCGAWARGSCCRPACVKHLPHAEFCIWSLLYVGEQSSGATTVPVWAVACNKHNYHLMSVYYVVASVLSTLHTLSHLVLVVTTLQSLLVLFCG